MNMIRMELNRHERFLKLNLILYDNDIQYKFNAKKKLLERKIEEIVSNRVIETLDVNFLKDKVFLGITLTEIHYI